MKLSCDNPDCAIAETGRCARAAEFSDPEAECPDRVSVDEPSLIQALPAAPAPTDEAGEPAPWSGESLAPGECLDLLARTQPIVVAVAGPHDAGKTCLLVSLFLQIANGRLQDFPYRFASSRSLLGFYRLAQRAAKWSGTKSEQIVDHTPITQEQTRFLHLGLRPADRGDDRHLDLLLSDLPGEWFKTWSTAPGKEVRAQFVARAHAVLVVADASKAHQRRYDAKLGQLIERLITVGRPLAVIFAKLDLVNQVPPQDPLAPHTAWGALGRGRRLWTQLDKARKAGLWGAAYGVSAFPGPLRENVAQGVLTPFLNVLQLADQRTRWRPVAPPIPDDAIGFDTLRRRERV